jgi:hypothetical protein
MIVRTNARVTAVVGLLMTVCITSGCDERLQDFTGPTPNLQPTFSSIRSEILQAGGQTACVNCHTPTGPVLARILDLSGDAHAALVNASSRQSAGARLVIPGDPDNSYLVHKLEGRSGIVGLRMPMSGPPFLTDGQILVIRRWIENGAPDN